MRCWMASPTQRTQVWVNSGRWWCTGRPGVLRFMGSQRVEHNWVTELNWIICYCSFKITVFWLLCGEKTMHTRVKAGSKVGGRQARLEGLLCWDSGTQASSSHDFCCPEGVTWGHCRNCCAVSERGGNKFFKVKMKLNFVQMLNANLFWSY